MEVKNCITCVTHEDIKNAPFYIIFPEFDGDLSDLEAESIEEYIIISNTISEGLPKLVPAQPSTSANGSPVSLSKSLASVIQTAVSKCQPQPARKTRDFNVHPGPACQSHSRQISANGLCSSNKSRQNMKNTNKAGIKDNNNNDVPAILTSAPRRVSVNDPALSNRSKGQAVPVRPSSSCPILPKSNCPPTNPRRSTIPTKCNPVKVLSSTGNKAKK